MLRCVLEGDLQTFFEQQHDLEATSLAVYPVREWDAFASHWRNDVFGDRPLKRGPFLSPIE